LTRDEQSVTFDDAGTYPYMCPLHPGMIGAIVVGSGEGGAAPAATSADATSPTRQTEAPLAPV